MDVLPYIWATGEHISRFAYWHVADSTSGKLDTIQNAMTVELRNAMMLTTTRLQGAQIIKSDLLRRTPQGIMRVLACDDGTLLEQVFMPFPKVTGEIWAIKACTGDTVSTLRIQCADTTITVPAGTFRVAQLREVDFTTLTTDFFLNDTVGLVQMTFQHSVLERSGTRYAADPNARPFEGFVLAKAGKRRR